MTTRCEPTIIRVGEHVCARDRVTGRTLLGGLGVMGVGHMWFDDEAWFVGKSDWLDAPDHDAPPRGVPFSDSIVPENALRESGDPS